MHGAADRRNRCCLQRWVRKARLSCCCAVSLCSSRQAELMLLLRRRVFAGEEEGVEAERAFGVVLEVDGARARRDDGLAAAPGAGVRWQRRAAACARCTCPLRWSRRPPRRRRARPASRRAGVLHRLELGKRIRHLCGQVRTPDAQCAPPAPTWAARQCATWRRRTTPRVWSASLARRSRTRSCRQRIASAVSAFRQTRARARASSLAASDAVSRMVRRQRGAGSTHAVRSWSVCISTGHDIYRAHESQRAPARRPRRRRSQQRGPPPHAPPRLELPHARLLVGPPLPSSTRAAACAPPRWAARWAHAAQRPRRSKPSMTAASIPHRRLLRKRPPPPASPASQPTLR